MALGRNTLEQIKLAQSAALKVCRDQLPQQLEVFREVNNSLSRWAGETVIGDNIRSDMTTLIDGIDGMINSTRIICGAIGDYVYAQEHTNEVGIYNQ